MALTEEQRIYQRDWKRRYRAEHPAFAAEYRKEHLEAMRLAQRKSKQKHADRCKKVRAAYKVKHPRRIWVQNSVQAHKREGFPIEISLGELYAYAESSKSCAYCGQNLDWAPFKGTPQFNSPTFDRINNGTTSDHIWRGDDFSDGGIAIACVSCNSQKRGIPLKEWLASVRER